MAEVRNVKLTIVPGGSEDLKNVTVSYTLEFAMDEIGRKHKVSITLLGKERMRDDEGGSFSGRPEWRYTFMFGRFPLMERYKIVRAEAGEHYFSETREINGNTLNEDPGVSVRLGPSPDISAPSPLTVSSHFDEVFASVSVSTEARSATRRLFMRPLQSQGKRS